MLPEQTSIRIQQTFSAMKGVTQFMMRYRGWLKTFHGEPCDFALGNPHEMPLPEFVAALMEAVPPQNKDWYGYTVNAPSATKTVAQALVQQFERPYVADDIILTNGATGAIDVVMNLVIDFGDEVVFNNPPWFFYEAMIKNSGGAPIQVKIDPESFDLDLVAIENAITPKTRLVLINSPNNPTGKIYPPDTLQGLAELLTKASAKYGRTIYLLSDEAYRQILFDENTFHSPTTFYPESFMVYTYGKTLLTPGQRLGYIALSPEMAERETMRRAVQMAQFVNGLSTANALLQHALPNISSLSIDLTHLQEKRDRLLTALRSSGYQVHAPEGTFYLFPRSPIADDEAYTDLLAAEGVFCLPGKTVEMPGYFRISLTANDEMIERAIPRFAAVKARVSDVPASS